MLNAEEAQAAEEQVLGRAGRLTPEGLREAIARAVMDVAPQKAMKRREHAAKSARVERWGEDSGNGALAGRELPPAGVLAADHRITWWARQLRKAGLDGDMDQLRARAYLDLLCGTDSRPGTSPGHRGAAAGQAGPAYPAGLVPAGFATWHACARPAPRSSTTHARRGSTQPRPPGATGNRDGPGSAFSFTRTSRDGPPGSPGTWTLTVHGREYQVTSDPLTTESCDHRHEASGHDPGVKLRHLAQIRHATCTGPVCRRPASQCDFEHNISYEAGGRTCLCNAGPKCRHDHRVKQDPRWKVEQRPDGTFAWTTPSGRTYTTEPTRYPI